MLENTISTRSWFEAWTSSVYLKSTVRKKHGYGKITKERPKHTIFVWGLDFTSVPQKHCLKFNHGAGKTQNKHTHILMYVEKSAMSMKDDYQM